MDLKTKLLILAVVVVALSIVFSRKSEGMRTVVGTVNTASPLEVYNFLHKLPANRYSEIVQEFGDPTVLADEPNGWALWKNPDYFEEIILRDESITHVSPKTHCDYLYVTVKVHIPDEKLLDVMKISDTLTYDRQKQELTCKCQSVPMCVAGLYMAMRVVDNGFLISQVQSDYAKFSLTALDKENYRIIYDELKIMVIDNQELNLGKMPTKGCLIPI